MNISQLLENQRKNKLVNVNLNKTVYSSIESL